MKRVKQLISSAWERIVLQAKLLLYKFKYLEQGPQERLMLAAGYTFDDIDEIVIDYIKSKIGERVLAKLSARELVKMVHSYHIREEACSSEISYWEN